MGAPSISGWGGGGGQGRARGRHLTAVNTLSASGRFNQWGGGGGGRGRCCPLSTNSTRGAVRFQPIQPVEGAMAPPGDAHN